MATMGSLKDVPSYVYYIAIAATYLFSVVIYRRYFHPLAKVPGPFLATVSHLYQFYHNSIRKGQLYLEIEKLHERYGMNTLLLFGYKGLIAPNMYQDRLSGSPLTRST